MHKLLFYNKFIICLYMFQALFCSSSVGQNCIIQPWGPPSLLYNEYRVFPGGKERPGREADPSPSSSAVVKKE